MQPDQPLIALTNATFRRVGASASGPPFALSNLTWALHPGDHWAILGPTGSGKSLFLDALAGRVGVAAGQRRYVADLSLTAINLVPRDFSFDRRVASAAQFYQQRYSADAAQLAPTVWAVLQEQVLPVGTVDPASVTLPPPAHPADWLADVAQTMQITHLLDRPLTSLSNGETRRTLLARTLLRRPRVLLLDNPFVGLDAHSRALLHETLNRVAQSGVSLVLVTDEREIPTAITHRLHLTAPAQISNTLPTPEPVRRALTAADTFTNAIVLREVQVRYGNMVVLDKISWTVRRGEKWALLGPNGSGKSTLLSLITADNPQAYANHVELFDRRRGVGQSIWAVKQRMGFVSPELHLYFDRNTTVWSAVASGLFDSMGLFRKLTDAQTMQVTAQLQALDLWALRDETLASLSVGQQRWTLLARALVKQPPLLILDEPTQGLDTPHIDAFRTLIDTYCAQAPETTLIYVTHYPDELPRCITQTLRLEKGRVV
ncbi:putative molybdenum transport ATP-binding protein modF Photorepair protein phrA [Fibrella aestuarina BUZ 2]|uniref:Putative molybdenum transport ATP-binding protein modF Photorepair protein phrA n=1 Tax=Fibrella aestuarina BUZ 2 TaxID=1166018 RepID=I0K9I0_9BACT|nr:ATP-binding cassette domain-containing protein [Fibrella aestuarina]CCH00783.1 putative molybdenum transport ATP-binding protein modF Photorepair protein phrA [Fibrella aestuarina BUZ 2]